jgi:hypothetical protein
MCGCNQGASTVTSEVSAAVTPAVTDETVYTVVYFNGVTEEAIGVDQVRRLLTNPDLRVEGADPRQGGTYAAKR